MYAQAHRFATAIFLFVDFWSYKTKKLKQMKNLTICLALGFWAVACDWIVLVLVFFNHHHNTEQHAIWRHLLHQAITPNGNHFFFWCLSDGVTPFKGTQFMPQKSIGTQKHQKPIWLSRLLHLDLLFIMSLFNLIFLLKKYFFSLVLLSAACERWLMDRTHGLAAVAFHF